MDSRIPLPMNRMFVQVGNKLEKHELGFSQAYRLMIPGSTHQPPLEFPETWLGLWKDATGRVVFLHRVSARQVQVSLFQGLRLPPFPMSDGGMSLLLPAVYMQEPASGPMLQVQVDVDEINPSLFFRFNAPQGDRLRFAEPWDMVSLITMQPVIVGDGQDLHWMTPVGPYQKANEEWDAFASAHPDFV